MHAQEAPRTAPTWVRFAHSILSRFDPAKERIALRDAITSLLAAKAAANKSPRYIISLRQYLNQFARGREAAPLDSITAQTVEAWFAGRTTEGLSSRASNLGRLSALFSYCVRRGWITENPCDRVERISVLRKPPRILNVRKCLRALAWCRRNAPLQFQRWLALALLAGLRPEEADAVAVVNLDSGTVIVEATTSKVRHRRVVILTPGALRWMPIEDMPAISQTTRRRWQRKLRDYLGFDSWPQDLLRHTAASHMLECWRDAARVAHELGNSPKILLTHYRELVPAGDGAKFCGLTVAPTTAHE